MSAKFGRQLTQLPFPPCLAFSEEDYRQSILTAGIEEKLLIDIVVFLLPLSGDNDSLLSSIFLPLRFSTESAEYRYLLYSDSNSSSSV